MIRNPCCLVQHPLRSLRPATVRVLAKPSSGSVIVCLDTVARQTPFGSKTFVSTGFSTFHHGFAVNICNSGEIRAMRTRIKFRGSSDVLWSYQRATISSTSQEVTQRQMRTNMQTQKLSWSQKSQLLLQSQAETSEKTAGIMARRQRLLSTIPFKPRSHQKLESRRSKSSGSNNIYGGTGAGANDDLEDGDNPVATLQKSLAAVPHYAVKNEIKLRYTEIDSKGNIVRSTSGEFLKSDLCQQYGLHPRDLRKIDGGFSNQMPVVLVRPEVILVNLGHIRALIKADHIVLFDFPDSKDKIEDSPFVKDLQVKLRMDIVEAGGQAYEFRALEAIFVSVVASLHAEMEILVHFVTKLLASIEEEIDQNKLKEMLQYTKKVSRFESKTLLIRDVFEELLDQDEDLAALYLTEKKEGHPRMVDQHDEAEILLEAYMKQVEEIANVVTVVKHQMQSTEDFVNVILGAKRNQLLLFELRIAMGTLGISSGAIIAGFYGMNLRNYLEQDPYAFFVVTVAALGISGSVFGACARKLRILARGTT